VANSSIYTKRSRVSLSAVVKMEMTTDATVERFAALKVLTPWSQRVAVLVGGRVISKNAAWRLLPNLSAILKTKLQR
jgi:hypothetical protein